MLAALCFLCLCCRVIDLVLLWCEAWIVGGADDRTSEAGQGKAGKKGSIIVHRCNAKRSNWRVSPFQIRQCQRTWQDRALVENGTGWNVTRFPLSDKAVSIVLPFAVRRSLGA